MNTSTIVHTIDFYTASLEHYQHKLRGSHGDDEIKWKRLIDKNKEVLCALEDLHREIFFSN